MTTTAPVDAPPRRPPRQPRNHVALLLSLVSGFGHLYLDHYLLGAALFAVFVTALNGVFLGFTLQSLEHPQWVQWTSIVVGVVTWVGAFWHCWLLSYGTDRLAIAREKEHLLRDGLLAYLRDELEQALSLLERAVELDIDWEDPDPLFHLGVVTSRMAERRARRGDSMGARIDRRRAQWAFRTCLQRDPTRKWAEEIQTELKRMRRTVSVTGRLRPLPGPGQFGESTDMLPRLGSIQMPVRKLETPPAPEPTPPPPSEVETVELEAPPKPKLPEPDLADQPSRIGAGRRNRRATGLLLRCARINSR